MDLQAQKWGTLLTTKIQGKIGWEGVQFEKEYWFQGDFLTSCADIFNQSCTWIVARLNLEIELYVKTVFLDGHLEE